MLHKTDVNLMKKSAVKIVVEVWKWSGKLLNEKGCWGVDSKYRSEQITKFREDSTIWPESSQRPVWVEEIGFFDLWRNGSKLIGGAFLFQDCLYLAPRNFTRDEQSLLVMELADSERKLFEKLRMKFVSSEAQEASKPRMQIKEAVRIAVWRRDQGRCVECKKRENLEYDHVIPVEKGGASTVRNVQLLCVSCNQQKGNRIDEVPFRLA